MMDIPFKPSSAPSALQARAKIKEKVVEIAETHNREKLKSQEEKKRASLKSISEIEREEKEQMRVAR